MVQKFFHVWKPAALRLRRSRLRGFFTLVFSVDFYWGWNAFKRGSFGEIRKSLVQLSLKNSWEILRPVYRNKLRPRFIKCVFPFTKICKNSFLCHRILKFVRTGNNIFQMFRLRLRMCTYVYDGSSSWCWCWRKSQIIGLYRIFIFSIFFGTVSRCTSVFFYFLLRVCGVWCVVCGVWCRMSDRSSAQMFSTSSIQLCNWTHNYNAILNFNTVNETRSFITQLFGFLASNRDWIQPWDQ